MSPILVRPVREQLEHDRVIRLLQAKYKKKYDVGINPGAEQGAPVGSGTSAVFPDLVLQSGRKLMDVIPHMKIRFQRPPQAVPLISRIE